MKSSRVSERLRYLADAACTSEISDAEMRELQALLAADPAARRFYADFCRMHAELYLALRAERAVNSAGGEKGDSSHWCEAPFGPFRKMAAVPCFPCELAARGEESGVRSQESEVGGEGSLGAAV